MRNCVLHVEQLFSNTCSIRLDDDISWTTFWAVDPVWGVVKNVIGRLQTVKNPVLQVIGCSARSAVDTIKWVDYGTWLSQPERAKNMVLEAYPEGWLILTAVMVFTWRIAERFVRQIGAWKLYKMNYVLPHKKEPPDPPHKPVKGVTRRQVLASLIALMLKHQAGAQVPDVRGCVSPSTSE